MNSNHLVIWASDSTWPIMLIPYNLPLWKCMKEAGKEIIIYLQPLIEELKDLWSHGIETNNTHRGQNFSLHTALMWIINNFLTHGNLSGWSTKGYKTCLLCN